MINEELRQYYESGGLQRSAQMQLPTWEWIYIPTITACMGRIDYQRRYDFGWCAYQSNGQSGAEAPEE